MATRAHTDADFNQSSRRVECMVEIYFEGSTLTITDSNYLASLDMLEELAAESNNPIGTASANELSMTLYNSSGIFTPTNSEGPYYGLIKKGLMIKPYMRLVLTAVAPLVPDTLTWIPLGVYYVRDWKTEISGVIAQVYATDIMEDVLKTDTSQVQVMPDYTFKQYLDYVFTTIGYTATVSADLTDQIAYAHSAAKADEFLPELLIGARSACFSNRLGSIVAEPLLKTRTLRATLTDADQLKALSAGQSIIKTYDGIDFVYSLPQKTFNTQVLEVAEFKVPTGTKTHAVMDFDSGPVMAIDYVALQTEDNKLTPTTFSYTPWTITLTTYSSIGSEQETLLGVFGTLIEFTDTHITDETENTMQFNNRYIQNETLATTYKSFLDTFIKHDLPILTVTIRGNLLLELGDKVTISSTRYNTVFVGVITRMQHSYTGSLSTILTLINATLLEVS